MEDTEAPEFAELSLCSKAFNEDFGIVLIPGF